MNFKYLSFISTPVPIQYKNLRFYIINLINNTQFFSCTVLNLLTFVYTCDHEAETLFIILLKKNIIILFYSANVDGRKCNYLVYAKLFK